ncbi:MAG: Holliday junction resolvase RuvX [Prevotella sp.]|nr:Holliday junction resolvase RuvX [Prevotella sp.]
MARILSIDYGKKRTGLAVTDPMQLIANGLTTVNTKDLFDFLLQYIQREKVERIIIGKPTQMNAAPSENMARIENFVGRWRKLQPAIPVEYYDERFTSVLAHRAILEGGVKKKVRRENKGLVDEISAIIILQDYLNYRK